MDVKENLRFARLVTPVLADGISRAALATASRPLRRRRVDARVARTDYDPINPTIAAQPHEYYRRMLAGPPVHYNPKRDLWIISHYDAVRAALRCPNVLSTALSVMRYDVSLPTMLTSDPPRHTDLRRVGQGAFTRRGLQAWQPVIDELAVNLVDTALTEPSLDIVNGLASPMPTQLIAHILGIPAADYAEFREWSTRMVRLVDITLPSGWRRVAEVAASVQKFHAYIERRFASGELLSGDTALARAQRASDQGALTATDLFYFALLLLLAGNETTTNMLGTLFLNLAENPDQYDLIRKDPDLIPGAIEEQLRHSSPIQGFYRKALQDYEVDGITIPAGSRVLLLFGAANRDPRQFDEPDQFRIDRDATGHLGFGHGVHFCLGAPLARKEGQAVLRRLAETTRRIELTGTPVWTTNSALRGLTRLPITLVRDQA